MSNKESRVKVFKAKISNAQCVLANFDKFLSEFMPVRDMPFLEMRQKEVASERDNFEKCATEMEMLEEETDYGSIRTQFDETYFPCYSKYSRFLSVATTSVNTNAQNQSANSLASSQSLNHLDNFHIESRSSTEVHGAKLPLLNIPTFSGSYDTWLGFHDLFKSLVDDNKNITDIEKLYHLKGCLKGDAEAVIALIGLSSDNCSVAWTLLKERYDNLKVIRECHVKSILNLPRVSKDSPVRSLLNLVQNHTRALIALKEPVDKWDTLLIIIIK